MGDLKTSWLVQRLEKPWGELDSPFSGSGPFRDDVRKALETAFSCDYMGSAEFEFGTIGKAVDALARRQAELRTKTIELTITAHELEKESAARSLEWAQKRRDRDDPKEIPELKAVVAWMNDPHIVPIYILAPETLMDYAEKFVTEEAQKPHRLKEGTFFRSHLLHQRYRENHVGWFELDNGFMFFSDKTMFDRTAAIFGVETPASSPGAALREAVPLTVAKEAVSAEPG